MSQKSINERRNWKAQTFPYDYYLPDASIECTYCLTDKQAELLRGLLLPVGWATRWWSDSDADIDPDTVEAFRDDLIRRLMMGCCGDEVPVQYRYTSDGVLQKSDDGGATWTDAPAYDPRQNSPQFPPVAGEDGSDKKCVAAAGAAALIKAQVGDQLTDGMSRYTLGQLITDWTGTVINSGGNIFQALVTVATNQIFALVIATLRPALTDTVYHLLQCVFFCNMADDASVNDAQWSQIRSDITDQIGGIAGVFLEHLVYLLGAGGLTNLLRAGGATTGDCSDCDECAEGCDMDNWAMTVYGGNNVGTLIGRGVHYIDVQTENVPGFGGALFAQITTPDLNTCCVYDGYEIISGPGLDGQSGLYCGQALWPTTEVHSISAGDELNTVRVFTATTSIVRIKFL